MPDNRSISKAAFILHADVAGSTLLVQHDEFLTHDRVQAAFRLFGDYIGKYQGRVLEVRGDALIAIFERASDAIHASLAFQTDHNFNLAQIDDNIRPAVRIGIAMGEVITADNTITGAGVVLAQRVEQIADPGEVCVTSALHEALPKRQLFELDSLGEHSLKGFQDPFRIYRVRLKSGATIPSPQAETPGQAPRKYRRAAVAAAIVFAAIAIALVFAIYLHSPAEHSVTAEQTALQLADKPAVAVLRFNNMSDDADQVIFADGVSEDIITDLSKVSGLFVVARDSAFAYQDSGTGLANIAEQLGVRYILTGSVRRAGSAIRVTAQLVDTSGGVILWSERFDRELKDVFTVQSEIASRVARALSVTLQSGEQERLFQKYTTSIEAYDAFIRARQTVDSPSRENVARGEQLFGRVIELDPEFAGGYAGLSFNYSVKARFGYGTSREDDSKRSLEYARKAIEKDRQFGWSYVALGGAQLAAGDAAAAVETMRRALVLQPGDHETNLFLGLYLQFAGEAEQAVSHLELANRMNPAGSVRNLAFLGMAYYMSGRYMQSADIWTRRLDSFPMGNEIAFVFLAASHAQQGDIDKAKEITAKLYDKFPDFKLDSWQWIHNYRLEKDREHLIAGARLAGIS